MLTHAGRQYRLALGLANAEYLGPSWLSAAVTGTYPPADLAAVEHYDGLQAVVLVRWRRGTGEIAEGDELSSAAEGIQVLGPLPRATVLSVAEAELYLSPSEAVREAVEELPGQWSAAIKLTAAGGLLLAVWYLSNRVRRKHAEPGRAIAGPYPRPTA